MGKDGKRKQKEKKEGSKFSKEDLRLIGKIGKKAFNELKTKEAENAAKAMETANTGEEKENKQEKIPAPAIIKETPTVQTEEQKEEERTRKLGEVIEMSEITNLRKMPDVTIYEVEDLQGNSPWRMTLSKMMGKITENKIGDIISIRQKVMKGKTAKRFLAVVPKSLIGRTKLIHKRKKVPEYVWATLIPENIPSECDPRILKALGEKLEISDLRINANIRDGLKADPSGNYVCEIELGYNITEKVPNDRTSKGMYTAVPYINLFPRSGEVEGPEYKIRVLMGPLDEMKKGSIIVGPSKGLKLLRKENVEAVTLYLILEPIAQ